MRATWLNLLACAIVCVASTGVRGEDDLPNAYFPLVKGAFWTYRADLDWTKPTAESGTGNHPVAHGLVTWKCEITDVFENIHVRAAHLRGWVSDLTWYEPGQKAGGYVIVQVGANHYHLLSEEVDRDVWQQIVANKADFAELLSGDNLILEAPLCHGAIFGDFGHTPQARYCSVVIGEYPFQSNGILLRGVRPGTTAFEIRFQTNPDHSITSFVPGLGVTRFVYRHHGTTSNCDARLIEAHVPRETR